MLNRKKVILDVDTGSDDAVAIMLATRSEELEILGITVTWGNRPVDNCVENTLRVLDLMERDIPVYKGCPQPMVRYLTRQRNAALDQDGISANIGGQEVTVHPAYLDLPPAVLRAQESHACTFLVETLRNAKEKVTLIPVGPPTNIGMALRMAPEIKENIEEIVLMGGAYQHGNVAPAAEFNIYADAEAAHVVFSCGRPVVMMGLDLTRQALCYPEIVDRMSKIETKGGKLFVDLMRSFCMTQKKVFGWEGGPLHDPTTVAYLIVPVCIETKAMHTDIDNSDGQSHGRTNCDFFNLTDKVKNTKVAVKLHVDRFWDIVEENLKLYDHL